MFCYHYRYATVRKQFGPPDSNEEVPLIEYPLHVSVEHSYCAEHSIYFGMKRFYFFVGPPKCLQNSL